MSDRSGPVIDSAMERGTGLAAAVAFDRPWAQSLGYARDLVAFCVVAYGLMLVWGVLS